MRIAVGQLWQETNTFNRNPTTFADFENWGLAYGPSLLEEYGETGEIGGFVAECRRWKPDIEFVGIARFACWPWGPVAADCWHHVLESFRERLLAAGKVDAVFLALHGAMAADGEPDVTGALLEFCREIIGPNVPLVGSLDLHANITRRMLEHADLLCGYHTCPHLDSAETGARAARGLQALLTEGGQVRTHWRKLPMITAAESHDTFTGPPAPLYDRLKVLEQDPQVLSAGLYMAMPWFDCPELGWTVTLATNTPPGNKGKSTRWKRIVDELADACWQLRHAMEKVERYSPADIVDRALQQTGHPVVIGDGADATNSGAPGDSTHLLREFLSRPSIPHGALTFLVDPMAVATAWQAGIGGPFDAMVGAAFAPEFSEPVRLKGTVGRLLQVDFVLDGHISRNLPIHMGKGAVIRSGDVAVLLVEKSGPGSTPKLYETAGLDPREFGIVVAKSPAGFRADYGPFAAAMFSADCPGCAAPNWKRLNFHRAHRPLFPLNAIHSPDEAKWCARRGQ